MWENPFWPQSLSLRLKVSRQTRQLVLNRLRLALALYRDADMESRSHRCPPTVIDPAAVEDRGVAWYRCVCSSGAGAGRPDPTAGLHPPSCATDDVGATDVSWAPPQCARSL